MPRRVGGAGSNNQLEARQSRCVIALGLSERHMQNKAPWTRGKQVWHGLASLQVHFSTDRCQKEIRGKWERGKWERGKGEGGKRGGGTDGSGASQWNVFRLSIVTSADRVTPKGTAVPPNTTNQSPAVGCGQMRVRGAVR
jgi:hypothetical protein